MSTKRREFGTHPYIDLSGGDRPVSVPPEEIKLKHYDRSTLRKTPLRVFLPYDRLGSIPNLLANFENELMGELKSAEEDLMIAQAKVNDLNSTIADLEKPSEVISSRKRLADDELELAKTLVTDKMTRKFEVILRWLIHEWPQIKLATYKVNFDFGVAVSSLFDYLDYQENRFGLKANPVRKNLIDIISKDCDDERVLMVVAQEETLSHPREELDRITSEIAPVDEIGANSRTYTISKTIPGIPAPKDKPGQTMRPTFVKADEAQREYEKSLMQQAAVEGRLASRTKSPWSPALAKKADEERRRTEADVTTMTNELAGRLIPKMAPLPSFEGVSTPPPEKFISEIPEAPKTTPATPKTLAPKAKTALITNPDSSTLVGREHVGTSSTPSTPAAALNSGTSGTPAALKTPDSSEPPAYEAKKLTLLTTPPAKPAKKSIWGRVAASVGVIAVAGLALFGLGKSKNQPQQMDSVAQSSSAMASAIPTNMSSAPVVEERKEPVPVVTAKPPVMKAENAPAARSFAKVLNDSKSPIVQDILNKGQTKLAIKNGTIVGMFIDSFQGLTNDRQKVEMKELERMINLGIGVYFNEHFGDPAKVDAILRGTDQRMKNLYRTAKYAKEKGWTNSGLTKEKYPEAYAFAEMILKDASDLQMDESDNPDPDVKASVVGNMFQAKMIGSDLKVRKADGQYHVILECIFKIFEGKNVHDALKQVQAARQTKAAEVVSNPAPAPKNSGQVNQSPTNGQNGTILPNILINPGQIDRRVNDLKMMEEVDAGWDEIAEQQDVLDFEKQLFEKNDTVDFQLPMGMTKTERTKLIVPKVAEEVARLYPHADQQKLRSMIKQWGYIGFAGVKDNGDKVEVKLHPNFMKILRMVINKKAVSNS